MSNSQMAFRRLKKEMLDLMNRPPDGISLVNSNNESLSEWQVKLTGAENTIYADESFDLSIRFSSKYPFDSPRVMFVGSNIPVHPHVYSNGHICLSILTEDWSPAMSVESICMSLISMLSSCREKKRPPDNDFYVRSCNANPKKTRWWFHDDSV